VTGDIQVINILVMLMFGMDRRRRIKPVDYARCQIQLGCDRTGFQKQFVSDEIGNQKVFFLCSLCYYTTCNLIKMRIIVMEVGMCPASQQRGWSAQVVGRRQFSCLRACVGCRTGLFGLRHLWVGATASWHGACQTYSGHSNHKQCTSDVI